MPEPTAHAATLSFAAQDVAPHGNATSAETATTQVAATDNVPIGNTSKDKMNSAINVNSVARSTTPEPKPREADNAKLNIVMTTAENAV